MPRGIVKDNNTCAAICDANLRVPLWPTDDVSLGMLWHARREGGLTLYDYHGVRFAIIDRAVWLTYPERQKLTGEWRLAKLRVRKQLREVHVLRTQDWGELCD